MGSNNSKRDKFKPIKTITCYFAFSSFVKQRIILFTTLSKQTQKHTRIIIQKLLPSSSKPYEHRFTMKVSVSGYVIGRDEFTLEQLKKWVQQHNERFHTFATLRMQTLHLIDLIEKYFKLHRNDALILS